MGERFHKKGFFKSLVIFLFTLTITFGMFQLDAQAATRLNTTTATMYVGGSSLTLKISGTKVKSWSSSKKSVATVSSKGLVTAKAAGVATITCKGKDGKSYKCKVTVKRPYLNVNSKTVHIGKTFTLKLTGVKAKSFKSASSNATVSSSGLVTGKTAGTAKITVTGADGKNYTCTVIIEDHSYNNGYVTEEATCYSSGLKTYTCTTCGATKVEAIEKTEHNYITYGGVEATCAYEGYTGDTYCSECGKLINKGKSIPATGHQYDEGIVLSRSTCTYHGTIQYTCQTCGNEKYAALPLDANNHGDDNYTEIRDFASATCTEDGYTGDTYCMACSKLISKGQATEKTGHNWIRTEAVDATCTSDGYNKYFCTNCGKEEIVRTGAALGHDWIEYDYSNTCTENGCIEKQCQRCYETQRTEVPAKGHKWIKKTDDEGHNYITCEKCETTLYSYIYQSNCQFYAYDSCECVSSTSMNIAFEYRYYGNMDDERYCSDILPYLNVTSDNPSVVKILTGTSNDVTTYEGVRGISEGTANVNIYFHDILIETIQVKVGPLLKDAVIAYRNGDQERAFIGRNSYEQKKVVGAATVLDKSITDDMTDAEKVRAIYNWYEENTSYDQNYSDSIYAMFVWYGGVCNDYARSFGFLMDVLGIENYYVTGEVYYKNSESQWVYDGEHAWNVVYVDAGNGKGKQWYYVDLTWNVIDLDTTVAEHNAAKGKGAWIEKDWRHAGYKKVATASHKLRNWEYEAFTDPTSMGEDEKDGVQDFKLFQ